MATLVYSDADGRDRSFALGNEPVTVGRAVECAIRSEDPRVSRMHARFFLEQGTVWIEDLGSTHGIYVGPNKVQRAPVPTGEIILVGSLLLRLVPSSGTAPPPMGLHGTLATWLDLERKTRAAVEEERNAFAKRVGELHQVIAASAAAAPAVSRDSGDAGGKIAEVVRLRDEAEARAATLERALAAVQDELLVLRQVGGKPDEDVARLRAELAIARDRVFALEAEIADRAEWSNVVGAESTNLERELARVKSALDEAQAASSIAEHTIGEATREAQTLRQELDQLRRHSAAELEAARLELAKAREAKLVSDTSVGISTVEKLAEADLVIANLQRELAALKAGAGDGPSTRQRDADDQIVVITARAEKAEKELAAAQIRAQGAERNLSHATSQAAKAETRAAQLEQKLAESVDRVKMGDEQIAQSRERIITLEARINAGDAPVKAAEARADKLAAELAELTGVADTRGARIVELEQAVAVAEQRLRDGEARSATIQAELTGAVAKLSESEKRGALLQIKLDELSRADAAIAAAARTRDDANTRATELEQRTAEAERRADDAEKRASAADTMAKAMAKDVAEALRRAADADTHKRTTARELAELARRAAQAEAANVEVAAAAAQAGERVAQAEARVAQAEGRAAEVQQELAAKLEATRHELTEALEAAQRALTGKLETAQRELAAERQTALQLVDRKTQLERELAEARALIPALTARAEAAEQRVPALEAQLESQQERIDDLESGMAVSETAQQASLAEAREELSATKLQLIEATAAAAKRGKELDEEIGGLRHQLAELERQVAETEQARRAAELALHDARGELAELVRVAEQRAGATADEHDRLEDALRRASEAESKLAGLHAGAEAADLAIGRAGALQRQLDEALAKLAWLERESSARAHDTGRAAQVEAIAAERMAASEERLRDAETRAEQAQAQLAETERRASSAQHKTDQLAAELAQLERRAQLAEQAVQAGADAERRAQAAEAMIAEAERRAQAAEAMLAEAERRAQGAEAQLAATTSRVQGAELFERQLFDAQKRIAELEREVATADNVRSFAAETEREIAQLQRDLRDARTKLTQVTLDRDRLASDLRASRGDSETTNRRAPLDTKKLERDYDPEVTAKADLSKYEPFIAKASELQQRVNELEQQDAALRKLLAATEQRLREAIDGTEDEDSESTHTGSQLPMAFAEHLNILEESIDSLRANMRAASDETAMMEPSDSVIAVSSAVSQAAEHVERARAAIRAMSATLDLA